MGLWSVDILLRLQLCTTEKLLCVTVHVWHYCSQSGERYIVSLCVYGLLATVVLMNSKGSNFTDTIMTNIVQCSIHYMLIMLCTVVDTYCTTNWSFIRQILKMINCTTNYSLYVWHCVLSGRGSGLHSSVFSI